jgi:catechol 2,3-dioxygenase-like lactoylglutathione lyase family enzyme
MSDRISGLAGVVIWTTAERYPAMRAFYVDTLGLVPRSDRANFVSFVLSLPGSGDDVRLNVSVHREVEGAAGDPLRIMLLLRVDDIQATSTRLRAQGVTFLREPEQEPWGGWIATFTDPDGNVVQLLQPAP